MSRPDTGHLIAVYHYGSEDPIYYIDARTGILKGESDESGEDMSHALYAAERLEHPQLSRENDDLRRELKEMRIVVGELRAELREVYRYINGRTRDDGRRSNVID